MSTLKKILGRQARGSMTDEPDLDDPELGRVATLPVQPLNIRQYPYQRARDRSWGSYEVEPIDNPRQGVQGSRYILPATTYQPSSARSPGSRSGLPSPLLPIDTTHTRAVVRASYSDSEFSQNHIPVSPDRYVDALTIIEGDSPKTLENPNLSSLETTRANESKKQVKADHIPYSSEDDQQNPPHTTLVRELSSSGLNELAWSPASSIDEAQTVALAPHSYQDLSASVDPSRSVGFPRYILGAVDLPCTAPSAPSSDSISTDILNISSSLVENSEHIMETVHLPSVPSGASSGLISADPDAPSIDVDLPEGNTDRESSSGLQRASISRYSGSIVEDTGLRQMPEGGSELEHQATMKSLGKIARNEQRISSLSQENKQANLSMQVREDDRSMVGQQSLPLRPLGQRLTDLGPGSSQTSSSTSAERLARVTSSRGGRVDLCKESSSSSQLRSPTPPLLYGKGTISSHSVKNSVSPAQSYLFCSAAEDWETVSDMRGNTRGFSSEAVDTQTGSSLADNSDPGDISVIEPITGGPRRLGASQHPGLPRPHQAFVFVKDSRSGSTANIPVHDFEEGRLYQHPIPMVEGHLNPFVSSPPAMRPKEDSNIINHSVTLAHQTSQKRMSAKSSSTGGFDKLIDSYGSINDSRNCKDVANAHEGVIDQLKQESASKGPSRGSSAWLSTVSESASGEDLSLPLRSGSFAKITVLNSKANLTGTPEGTGAREVGSSLAGSSSPRDQCSSSPMPHSDPVRLLPVEIASPQTPSQQTEAHTLTTPEVASSAASRFHTPSGLQTFAPLATFEASSSFTSGIQTPSHQHTPEQNFATPNASSIYSSRAQSLSEYPSPASDLQSRLTSKARVLNGEGPSKQRRRRSSSESNCKVLASPSTTKASALPSPDLHGHKKRNTMVGLLSNYSPFDDADSKSSQHQTTMRERQGHQAYTESNQASVSTTSRSILHDGVVYSDVAPPVFVHPVYGSSRSSESPQQQRGRVQARPDKFPRPMARLESPHLHRIPYPPTTEVLERREQISKLWLPIFCAIPPCALIFGYGYADEIMRIQSGGEADSFTEWSKMFAIFWALSATPVTIVVAVVCVVFGSSI